MKSAIVILLFFITAVRGAGLSCTHNNNVANTFLKEVFEKYQQQHEENVNIAAVPKWFTLKDNWQLKAMGGNLQIHSVTKNVDPIYCRNVNKTRIRFVDGITIGPLEATGTATVRRGSTILSPNYGITGGINSITAKYQATLTLEPLNFKFEIISLKVEKPIITLTEGPKELECDKETKKLIKEIMKSNFYSFVESYYAKKQVKDELRDAILDVPFPENFP